MKKHLVFALSIDLLKNISTTSMCVCVCVFQRMIVYCLVEHETTSVSRSIFDDSAGRDEEEESFH